MKTISILTLTITAFLLSSFTGCETDVVEPIPEEETIEVSEEENLGLEYMREEEKLARDVYITLFEMYNNTVFNNISKAEQQHMDRILTLLEKYNITDPSLPNVGEFSNTTLQGLYDDLIIQGSESEEAALIVGATIEDLDIKDLNEFKAETTDPEIIKIYNALTCGSRNHMRAFTSRLDSLGLEYVPQFISQEEYDAIISGEGERCGQGG
ncbi:MAG: DUF2202 domain-containing protein [Bacteroidota bacterium]